MRIDSKTNRFVEIDAVAARIVFDFSCFFSGRNRFSMNPISIMCFSCDFQFHCSYFSIGKRKQNDCRKNYWPLICAASAKMKIEIFLAQHKTTHLNIQSNIILSSQTTIVTVYTQKHCMACDRHTRNVQDRAVRRICIETNE